MRVDIRVGDSGSENFIEEKLGTSFLSGFGLKKKLFLENMQN